VLDNRDVRLAGVFEKMLTRREMQVTRLVSHGLANKVIAEQLGLREGTVKIHLHNIYRKMRVPNRTVLMLNWIAERESQ
jgi:two-component system nitrate/nitrite response regulator NarL